SLSTDYEPLGSCSRAAGWSAATSCFGPSRHFAAMQHFSRFWSEADMMSLLGGRSTKNVKRAVSVTAANPPIVRPDPLPAFAPHLPRPRRPHLLDALHRFSCASAAC